MPASWFARGRAAVRASAPRIDAPLLTEAEWAEISHAVGHAATHGIAPPDARRPNPGEGRSRLRGRGLDYAESRAYQSGDDMRAMHWGLLARTGRPYVRVHEEEHAAPWHALVDAHAGMRFGTRVRTKAAQAARAALVGAALQARSTPRAALGLTLWTDVGMHSHRFGCGPGAVRRMAAWLMMRRITPCVGDGADAAHAVHAAGAFDAWARQLQAQSSRPARVVVCSDFAWLRSGAPSAPGGPASARIPATMASLAARSQLLALGIADPVELALPALPLVHLHDHASGVEGWLEPDAALRARFAMEAEARRVGLAAGLRGVGARVAQVMTGDGAASLRAALLPLMQ